MSITELAPIELQNKIDFSDKVGCQVYSQNFKLTHQHHRLYVEQQILHRFSDVQESYDLMLAKTAEWLKKNIKNQIQIFNSYSRPNLEKYPHELWIQPWILGLVMDLRKIGFIPLLDILDSDFTQRPDEFMRNGIETSDFVILHGSESLLDKYSGYQPTYIRAEINYILDRLRRKKESFLIPVRLSGNHVSDCFPAMLRGDHANVYEFNDGNNGIPTSTYLDFILYLIKGAVKSRSDKNGIEGLEQLWSSMSKKIKIPLCDNRFLSKEEFNEITSQLKITKENKNTSILDYIKSCMADVQTKGSLYFNEKEIALISKAHTNYFNEKFEIPNKIKNWNMPAGISHFIGREDELNWLTDNILNRDILTPSIISIYGLNGIGKTELIIRWVKQNKDRFNSIIWFNAESDKALNREYRNLARALGLIKDRVIDSNMVRNKLSDFFSKDIGWLIIFDNVKNYEWLVSYIPAIGHGYVLIVSTDGSISTCQQIVAYSEIKEMSQHHAVQ